MSEYSLGDAIRKFLNESRIKGSIQAMQVEEVWEQIMGRTIAKYTDSIRIHGHTLYIQTSVAALRQELIYRKPELISRVNEALGEQAVREVVIQ
jgi:hypothetical protein